MVQVQARSVVQDAARSKDLRQHQHNRRYRSAQGGQVQGRTVVQAAAGSKENPVPWDKIQVGMMSM